MVGTSARWMPPNVSGCSGQVSPAGGVVRSRRYDSTAPLMHALPPPKTEP
jgi:hypothetical protein